MAHDALMHDNVDDVAVVIHDVNAGDDVKAVTLAGEEMAVVKAADNIPLGHKIALRAMPQGKEVIKYGRAIGRSSTDIVEGAHVHVHNIQSIRWETSINE